MASGFLSATSSMSTPPSVENRIRGLFASRSTVGEVHLALDVRAGLDQHLPYDVSPDVHPEDLLRSGLRLLGVMDDLYAAGLAAAAGQDLGLDRDRSAKFLRRLPGLLRRLDDGARKRLDAVRSEQFLPLILVEIQSPRLPRSPPQRSELYRETPPRCSGYTAGSHGPTNRHKLRRRQHRHPGGCKASRNDTPHRHAGHRDRNAPGQSLR